MIIFLIISYSFTFSIYGNNYFYPGNKKSTYYFSNFYSNENYSYSLKISKFDRTFSLYHFNYAFPFKSYSVSVGDNYFYLDIPFGISVYLRGVKIQGSNFIFQFGKEREYSGYVPSFKRNDFFSLFEYNYSKSTNLNINYDLVIKKNKKMSPWFLNSLYSRYSGAYLSVENKFAFSVFESGFGLADEIYGEFIKEEKGINFRLRINTPNFCNLSLRKQKFSLNFGTRGFYKFNLKKFSYATAYSINFSQNYSGRIFRVNTRSTFFIPKFPIISFSGGINFINYEMIFKRSFEIVYDKKIFNIRFTHLKSMFESNNFNLRINIYPFLFNAYLIYSDGRTAKYEIRYIKNSIIRTGFYFGEELKNIYKRFLGISIYSKFSLLSLGLSYFLSNFSKKNYHNLSFSLSTALKPKEIGFSICEGVIYYDKNKNFTLDEGDRFMEGMEVILDNEKKVKTDKKGRFSFKFLKPGKHRIEIRYGALPAELGSAKGEKFEFETGLFGKKIFIIPIQELGELSGYVFVDKNRNGIKDENEKGIPNIIVSLNGYSTITDEEGRFYFTALRPGTYFLKIINAPFEYIYLEKGIEIKVGPGEKIRGVFLPLFKKEKKIKLYRF